jgi:hypothetical protein
MRANRPVPRADQILFRLVVSSVWLAVVAYMVVVMVMTG